jgi:hypothetical protein
MMGYVARISIGLNTKNATKSASLKRITLTGVALRVVYVLLEKSVVVLKILLTIKLQLNKSSETSLRASENVITLSYQ